jgi:hypothetical protein
MNAPNMPLSSAWVAAFGLDIPCTGEVPEYILVGKRGAAPKPVGLPHHGNDARRSAETAKSIPGPQSTFDENRAIGFDLYAPRLALHHV